MRQATPSQPRGWPRLPLALQPVALAALVAACWLGFQPGRQGGRPWGHRLSAAPAAEDAALQGGGLLVVDTSGAPEAETLEGREVLLQSGWEEPRGLLLLLHDCGRSAGAFWERSAACPQCTGLPEEMRMRTVATHRMLSVAAVGAADAARGCWAADEAAAVAGVLRQLAARPQRWTSPRAVAGGGGPPAEQEEGPALFVLGVGSGGELALALPRAAAALEPPLALQGVFALGAAARLSGLALPGGAAYPPTAFVRLARDAAAAEASAAAARELRAAGTPVHELTIEPRPVTAAFLASRATELRAPGVADAVVEALAAAGLLDGAGLQPRDPAGGEWRAALAGVLPEAAWPALEQLLGVAYAVRGAASDAFDCVMHWVELGAGYEAEVAAV